MNTTLVEAHAAIPARPASRMALSGEQADEFLRSLGKLEALDATQDDFGRNFLDNLQV